MYSSGKQEIIQKGSKKKKKEEKNMFIVVLGQTKLDFPIYLLVTLSSFIFMSI